MEPISYELPRMKYPEEKGLVSVIVPIYNNEDLLRECLDSILAQTFTNWEAILVNDGSTDNSGMIIDEYARKDQRFIAVHISNGGTLYARKTGLENSRGEFIANIDHDDVYDSQFLGKMYAKITESHVDFVWCECQLNTEKVNESLASYYVTDYKWSVDSSENIAMILTLGLGMSLLTWDKMIRRNVYTKVLFPTGHIVFGEDPIQIVQVAYHSKAAAFVDEVLYYHRLDGFSSNVKPVSLIRLSVIINDVIERLFGGTVPENVRTSYCRFMGWHNIAAYFFCLDKKQRGMFKEHIKPFMSKYIKFEKRAVVKGTLFLADRGMILPFAICWRIRKIVAKTVRFFVCGDKN